MQISFLIGIFVDFVYSGILSFCVNGELSLTHGTFTGWQNITGNIKINFLGPIGINGLFNSLNTFDNAMGNIFTMKISKKKIP